MTFSSLILAASQNPKKLLHVKKPHIYGKYERINFSTQFVPRCSQQRFQQSTPSSGVKVCQVVAGFVNPKKKQTAEALQRPKKIDPAKFPDFTYICHLFGFLARSNKNVCPFALCIYRSPE